MASMLYFKSNPGVDSEIKGVIVCITPDNMPISRSFLMTFSEILSKRGSYPKEKRVVKTPSAKNSFEKYKELRSLGRKLHADPPTCCTNAFGIIRAFLDSLTSAKTLPASE